MIIILIIIITMIIIIVNLLKNRLLLCVFSTEDEPSRGGRAGDRSRCSSGYSSDVDIQLTVISSASG